jgi:uncharacterized protein (TIGR03086 family)
MDRHRRSCRGFGAVVDRVGERWDRPTPCPEWDARGVLEHVIGFHDVLLLVPLGAKPSRPRDDPVARWAVTFEAVLSVLGPDGPLDRVGPASSAGDAPSYAKLLPMLTSDVLVHTWDLARSTGTELVLDAGLCEAALEGARRSEESRLASGMFAAPFEVPEGSDAPTRLVALMGRDPWWRGA